MVRPIAILMGATLCGVAWAQGADTRGIGVRRNSSINQLAPRVAPATLPSPQYVVPMPTMPVRLITGVPGAPEVLLRKFAPTYFESSGLSLIGRYTGEHWDVAFRLGINGWYHSINDARVLNFYPTDENDISGAARVTGAVTKPRVPLRVIGGGGATVFDQRTLESLTPEERARIGQSVGREIYHEKLREAMVRAGVESGPPKPPPTPMERATAAFQAGKPAEAVQALREHVNANPKDCGSMRLLAVALLDAGKPEECNAVMRRAYRLDGELADHAIDAETAGLDAARVRALVGKASAHANRTQNASAWLTVTVLMQAEGRHALAGTMVERARKTGLETDIAEPLAAALEAAAERAKRRK